MAFASDPKTAVIVDTDIGFDPDDFFALLLLLNSPELAIDLIVTGDECHGGRAALVRKILKLTGHGNIPVAAGADIGSSKYFLPELIQGIPAEPAGDDATEAIAKVLNTFDRAVYIGIQGMTNLARLIERQPDAAKKITLYQMAGALDFSRYPGWVEHNIRIDVPAARRVLASGVDITFIMAQTTTNIDLQFNDGQSVVQKTFASKNPVHQLLAQNILLARKRFLDDGKKNAWPYAHDPLTASVALGKDFVSFDRASIVLDAVGNTFISPDGTPMNISRKESRAKEFMGFLDERIFGCPTSKTSRDKKEGSSRLYF